LDKLPFYRGASKMVKLTVFLLDHAQLSYQRQKWLLDGPIERKEISWKKEL
jgi:hypothetical protein